MSILFACDYAPTNANASANVHDIFDIIYTIRLSVGWDSSTRTLPQDPFGPWVRRTRPQSRGVLIRSCFLLIFVLFKKNETPDDAMGEVSYPSRNDREQG